MAVSPSDDSNSCNLLHNADHIRNVCIMAHVDHGKTTFADSLIASNGIISSRFAGKLRYMDSRKDEQERKITMKSSSIALYHTVEANDYLINVIDCPGHVDFSFEVSTAGRLCDGALILVDVVEGVCPQTRSALKQAWDEKLKPLLILNKMDRLILEKELDPMSAYGRITQVLEQVNSIMGSLFRSDILEENESSTDTTHGDNPLSNWSCGFEDSDDSQLYFSPEDGNVIFASAIDGWGFTVADFAEKFSRKLDLSEEVLRRSLWGDYYLHSKSKLVQSGAQERMKKPLFVQLVLENIWKLYETVHVLRDKDKIKRIIENLKLNVKHQHLNLSDPTHVVYTIMGSWIPLAPTVLNSVCKILPPPNRLSEDRIDNLMFGSKNYYKPCERTMKLRSAFSQCSSTSEAPVIVFVSKMFPVEREHLPENRVKIRSVAERRDRAKQRQTLREEKRDDGEVETETSTAETECAPPPQGDSLIAFARIYSGCIRTGSRVYVFGPKHDPEKALKMLEQGYQIDEEKTMKDLNADEHITRVEIRKLYLLMGRELEELTEVPAGNVFGIGGLEEHVLKHATLSTDIACPPFTDLHLMATPILRVAVEPKNPGDLKQLLHGLKLLNQADASVQVLLQQSGEQVIVTTGEVHLQRCIADLEERYAKVPVSVSEPIIPFRETVIPPPKVDMVNEAITSERSHSQKVTEISISTLNNLCTVTIEAIPLPPAVTQFLERSANLIKYLTSRGAAGEKNEEIVTDFKTKLAKAFSPESSCGVENVWTFGPKMCGPNVLFNSVANVEAKMNLWTRNAAENVYTKYESSFLNGFQLATLAGPLCEEPMMGVGFVVTDWRISEDVLESGQFSGQLMSAVKDGCREAFQMQPQRLMAAMYSCNILVNTEALGRMYALLNKRNGRILHGDLETSSETIFSITAYLPVAESNAFASEVRKQTSGLANPQLVFSHWEVIELDPFWTPSTEDEYLLYGQKADSENYARIYMNRVRRRKGLPTDEKVVENAEKQRTLSKKK